MLVNGREMSAEEITRLILENDALKAAAGKTGTLGLKVSDKGGLSVFGINRFPVTLYASQWLRLLDFGPQMRAFIETHKADLKGKDGNPLVIDAKATTVSVEPAKPELRKAETVKQPQTPAKP